MTSATSAVALRMDDVGAASKRYEIYSDHAVSIRGRRIGYGNWLFLKYVAPFRKWGPYREMSPDEWDDVLALLAAANAKLTVAVTAAWVEDAHVLIPFPERFPGQAAALKRGVMAGLVEIANHGLTHCVLKDNVFKPRLFSGNRSQHREFWEWLPDSVHEQHVARAQAILQQWLGMPVVTFVPPGNVFAPATIAAARREGLRYLSCQTAPGRSLGMTVIGNTDIVAFHDRDIVLFGIDWLRRRLAEYATRGFCLVRDIGARMDAEAA